MVIHRDTGEIEHKIFKDIIDYFGENDVMYSTIPKFFQHVFMVIRKKPVLKLRFSCFRELNRDQGLWDVLVDPARKIRIGNKLYFGEDDSLVAEVIDNTTSPWQNLPISIRWRL